MKKVLIIGAISKYAIDGFQQACLELGLEPIFVLCKSHVPKVNGLCHDNTLLVDSLDIESLDIIIDAISPIQESIYSIVSGGELSVSITEKLCKSQGLPHNKGDISRFRDKYLMRKTLENVDNVNQPKVLAKISTLEEIERLEVDDLFPLIIKPTDGAASFFVKKVFSKEEIKDAFNPIFGHSYSKATGVKFLKTALLEEYIQGVEYSAEVMVSEYNVIGYSITRKVLSEEPYFDEIGHISMPIDNEPQGINEFISAIVTGMNVYCGVMHIEFRIQEETQKLFLIEVAIRIAGDLISNIVQRQHGFSLEKFLISVRGRERQSLPTVNLSGGTANYICVKFIFDDNFDQENENITILEHDIAQKYMASEVNSPKNVLNRRGYIIFSSPNINEALNFIGS